MRDSSAHIEITTPEDDDSAPSKVTIALGKDSGSFFLTRFDRSTDSDWDGGRAGRERAPEIEAAGQARDGATDRDLDELVALRGGFDESLGLPLAPASDMGRRPGIRHVVGAVTTALVIASAGFGLGAGIVDRDGTHLRGERVIAQVAEPIEVQGPDAAPFGELGDEDLAHDEMQHPSRQETSATLRRSTARQSRSLSVRETNEGTSVEQVTPFESEDESVAIAGGPNGSSSESDSTQQTLEQSELAVAVSQPLEDHETIDGTAPELPRSLTRQQVITGMRGITELVMNCTMTDRVVVDVTIDGDTGEVTRARIVGPMAGTAEGACVERSLRRAQFPRFRDERLNVRSYPFTLRAAR